MNQASVCAAVFAVAPREVSFVALTSTLWTFIMDSRYRASYCRRVQQVTGLGLAF